MNRTKKSHITAEQVHNTTNVLVVDDDPQVARSLLSILARKGIHGDLARDEKSAMAFVEAGTCDLVFANEKFLVSPTAGHINAGDGDTEPVRRGRLLQKIKRVMPEVPVIAIAEPEFPHSQALDKSTANDQHRPAEPMVLRQTVSRAVEAVRLGCRDFLLKPLEQDKVESLLDTFLPNQSVRVLDSAEDKGLSVYQIVGRSEGLARIIRMAERVAPTSVPVLVSGESGTGKELISYLIHCKSNRAMGPYVRVNCAALSESLLESELFGHERGAFTGAYARRKGRFEMADGGTLLLDEVTETPLKFQAKLLRVLEQQDFERVGGSESVRVNVRIISTTNKNLLQEVQEGRFRRDLYYRLSGVRLTIAPLRERKEDLPDLVWHFVNLYAREARRRITRLDPVMMDMFARYHWPGNVRQLRNVVRTCLILGSGQTLSLADVSWLFDEPSCYRQTACCTSVEPDDANASPDRQSNHRLNTNGGLGGVPLEQLERQAILDTLRQTAGNQAKAAKVLGISDRTLRDKIKRYRQQGCEALSR